MQSLITELCDIIVNTQVSDSKTKLNNLTEVEMLIEKVARYDTLKSQVLTQGQDKDN